MTFFPFNYIQSNNENGRSDFNLQKYKCVFIIIEENDIIYPR